MYKLVIHGGAGVISKSSMSNKKENDYRQQLKNTLIIGYNILSNGGSSIDAVEQCVKYMEDCPLFNAGKGSVYLKDGTHEMDAAIMDGKNCNAGAVCGVKNIKNPITLARKVMENTSHVLMAGKGAEEFARSLDIQFEIPSYFATEQRTKQLAKLLSKDINQSVLDHTVSSIVDDITVTTKNILSHAEFNDEIDDKKYGTVGAIALDIHGNLAAATSTGGTMLKLPGRIGDSPIIGAGTYANNRTCAVSCTGMGEYFIKSVAAYDVSARIEYGGISLKNAADAVVLKLKEIGGDGGLIALSNNGEFAMPFNTSGMYRGYVEENGECIVEIFK